MIRGGVDFHKPRRAPVHRDAVRVPGYATSRHMIGRVFSRGSELLWEVLVESGSAAATAHAVQICQNHLYKIAWGDRRPGLELVARCHNNLGIPVRAWFEKPAGEWPASRIHDWRREAAMKTRRRRRAS